MSEREDWWTHFFVDFFYELQSGTDADEQTKAEVDALERLLNLGEPLRILDIPCGAGRHSVELARRGHQVTGIDFNPKVVELAKRAARSAELRVDFRQGDMRELPFVAQFERAICHWGSFGYF